jgi:hypothetical protein
MSALSGCCEQDSRQQVGPEQSMALGVGCEEDEILDFCDNPSSPVYFRAASQHRHRDNSRDDPHSHSGKHDSPQKSK